MQKQAEEFRKRGVRILAVSVDPLEVTRDHAAKMGYTYPVFLADEKMEVIRRFDLMHEDGSFKIPGGDVSRPAEFLIDAAGVIRWRFFAEAYQKQYRLTGEHAIEVIDAVQAGE